MKEKSLAIFWNASSTLVSPILEATVLHYLLDHVHFLFIRHSDAFCVVLFVDGQCQFSWLKKKEEEEEEKMVADL